jgi:hypothetical protein
MLPKSNVKNFPQYENNYKEAFFSFFKFLTSEAEVDEKKRKFILECFERFKDTEEYDSTKDFFLDIFEEIGVATKNLADDNISITIGGNYGAVIQ